MWLARAPGPASIAEAVAATGAALVLVPAERAPTCGAIRRIDRTLDYYAARIPVPLIAVGRDGSLTRVAPLGGGAPGSGGSERGSLAGRRPPADRPSGALERALVGTAR